MDAQDYTAMDGTKPVERELVFVDAQLKTLTAAGLDALDEKLSVFANGKMTDDFFTEIGKDDLERLMLLVEGCMDQVDCDKKTLDDEQKKLAHQGILMPYINLVLFT